MQITAARLYDYVSCPHRVALDAFGSSAGRDPVSPFVRMLWERGSAFETKTLKQLKCDAIQISADAPDRGAATLQAMDSGAEIILGGRIAAGDLLGEPDLLIKCATGYMPADVKSGLGEEGDGEQSRLKAHYAVQIALYVDVLSCLGLGEGRLGEIWDVQGERIRYDLDQTLGARTEETWWTYYKRCRDEVRGILGRQVATSGALSAACGLCHWRSACRAELEAAGDLTQIPSLGRALRDRMAPVVGTLSDFAQADCEAYALNGAKTIFPGLGLKRLQLFQDRARLLTQPGAVPYLRDRVELPTAGHELFFDIEADPMRDLTYLHGFVERVGGEKAERRFTGFFADDATLSSERDAFAQAIAFMADRPECVIFYYSKYERTTYRKLQARYPEVCSAEEIEALFKHPRSIDLYFDVVTRATEWPTRSHSIKALAKYLGFAWRDTDPSGAASIEWYHRWIEERDPAIRQRILDYNEDDCVATAILLDKLRQMVEDYESELD